MVPLPIIVWYPSLTGGGSTVKALSNSGLTAAASPIYKTALALAYKIGVSIAEGDYAMFPVLPESAGKDHGQCMLQKHAAEKQHGIFVPAFGKMLDAANGLVILKVWAAMAGIDLDPDISCSKAEKIRALELIPIGTLRKPRKAAQEFHNLPSPRTVRVKTNS